MSVLLDTNVVSELIRTAPDPAVEAWAAGHALEDLFFSAVGEAELHYGAAIIPAGRRRESLVSDIEGMLSDAFDDRVLPFRQRGRPAPMRISRPCAVRPAARSRRRTARSQRSPGPAAWRWRRETSGDFDDIDIETVNPWTAA